MPNPNYRIKMSNVRFFFMIDSVQKRWMILNFFLAIQIYKLSQMAMSSIKLLGSDMVLGSRHLLYWSIADIFFFLVVGKYYKPQLKYFGVVVMALSMVVINCGLIAVLSSEFQNYTDLYHEEECFFIYLK